MNFLIATILMLVVMIMAMQMGKKSPSAILEAIRLKKDR